MEYPLNKFKEQQKKLAEEIKKNHDQADSYRYRHRHIAYCELRGTPREKIELPRENNEPSELLIETVKSKWTLLLEEWNSEREKING